MVDGSMRVVPILMVSCLLASSCSDGGGTADTRPDSVDDTAPDASGDTTADSATEAGGDTGADAADVVVPPPPDCGEGLSIERSADDGTVAFELYRCMPQICGGGCPVSQPQLVLRANGHVDVATPDTIEYTKTHHNWADALVATLPDRRLRWRVEFDFSEGMVERHFVSSETLDGTPILAETSFELR